MADQFDRATEIELLNTSDAIEAQRQKAAAEPVLNPMGYCRNPKCCEPFDETEAKKLFCGADCASEYAKFSK